MTKMYSSRNDFLNMFHDGDDRDHDYANEDYQEPAGRSAEYDENNLRNITFSAAVSLTHKNVREALESRFLDDKPVQHFYTDFTGRGKTSGIILALGHMFQARDIDRVLICTREIAGVEDLYMQFLATWPELCVAPWSGAHKEHGKRTDVPVERLHKVTRKEARKAQVVITTHSAATEWAKSGKYELGDSDDFDLCLIDEYPEPVEADTIKPSQVVEMKESNLNRKLKEVYEEVSDWFYELGDQDVIPRADWMDKIDASFNPRLVKLVEAANEGRAFATKDNRGYLVMSWVKLNIPFPDKAIIFSATNEVEGWKFDPRIDQDLQPDDTQKTNYEDLTVTFKNWPTGVVGTNSEIAKKWSAQVFGSIERAVGNLPDDDEDVLILMPKDLADKICEGWRETLASARGTEVYTNNWGRGIGSNTWKDCKHMIIFGLFHIAKEGLMEMRKAHEMYENNANNVEVFTFQERGQQVARVNHHTRHIIQMLNRIRIRKMVSNGNDMFKAQSGNTVWITQPKDRDTIETILVQNFPNVQIRHCMEMDPGDVIEDDLLDIRAVVGNKGNAEQKITMIFNYLDQNGITEITQTKLKEITGWKPTTSGQIEAVKRVANKMGWRIIPSSGRIGKKYVRKL